MKPHDKLEKKLDEFFEIEFAVYPGTNKKVVSVDAVRTFFSSLLSEQERGGWISCKDRLPNPSVDVLLSDGVSVFPGYMSMDERWYRNGRHSQSYGIIYWYEFPPLPPSPSTTKEKK